MKWLGQIPCSDTNMGQFLDFLTSKASPFQKVASSHHTADNSCTSWYVAFLQLPKPPGRKNKSSSDRFPGKKQKGTIKHIIKQMEAFQPVESGFNPSLVPGVDFVHPWYFREPCIPARVGGLNRTSSIHNWCRTVGLFPCLSLKVLDFVLKNGEPQQGDLFLLDFPSTPKPKEGPTRHANRCRPKFEARALGRLRCCPRGPAKRPPHPTRNPPRCSPEANANGFPNPTLTKKNIHGYGSKSNHQGTAGFGPCFHLLGLHLGYLFLTHSHISARPILPQPFQHPLNIKDHEAVLHIGQRGLVFVRVRKNTKKHCGSLVVGDNSDEI